MKLLLTFISLLLIVKSCGQSPDLSDTVYSGNPLFYRWYADPASRIYNDTFWIFPTYSDYYHEQVFFDCFSSTDLVNWTKHERIIDTTEVYWADSAMWTPA